MFFHLLVVALLVSFFNGGCTGFRIITDEKKPRPRASSLLPLRATSSPASDLSSGLISQLAEAAIRRRLKDHASVKCEVSAKNNGLLVSSFFVGPAVVKGRGWRSGLGLTCRAIEATVAMCELDKRTVVSEQRLVLKQAAVGDMMVALDGNDFSNFLAHPQLKPPSGSETSADDGTVQFLRQEVAIEPEGKLVSFCVRYADKKWRCALTRTKNEDRRAMVEACPYADGSSEDEDDEARLLGDKLTRYFNEILFELDGTFLTFRDMKITAKGASPSVMLKMGIRVEKFPSRNLAF